jgi:hypothetical protein
VSKRRTGCKVLMWELTGEKLHDPQAAHRPGDLRPRPDRTDGDISETDQVTVIVLPPGEAKSPPLVSAGPDLVVRLPKKHTILVGSVSDDGHPTGAVLNSTWSLLAGPGVVTGTNISSSPTSPTLDLSFGAPGTYLLRLTASGHRAFGVGRRGGHRDGSRGPQPGTDGLGRPRPSVPT